MPLSERISSVILSASWWLKTIVSENLSLNGIVVNFSFESRSTSTKWRRFLIRHSVDFLDDLGERVVVSFADPVGEHRRGDHDQLFAFKLGQVAAAGGQRAADHRQRRVEPARAVERRRRTRCHGRKYQRPVDEVRRILPLERLDQHRVLRLGRQVDRQRSYPARTTVKGTLPSLTTF